MKKNIEQKIDWWGRYEVNITSVTQSRSQASLQWKIIASNEPPLQHLHIILVTDHSSHLAGCYIMRIPELHVLASPLFSTHHVHSCEFYLIPALNWAHLLPQPPKSGASFTLLSPESLTISLEEGHHCKHPIGESPLIFFASCSPFCLQKTKGAQS